MKKISWICKFIVVVLCILGIAYAFPMILEGDWYEVGIRLTIILTALVPTMVRKILHLKISYTMELVYLLFIIFGHFIGSILGIYNEISHYDKIMHTLSGVLTSFIALIILNNINQYKFKNVIFNIVFMIVFSLAVAGIWEIFEFTSDILFQADAQKVAISGVNDTMLDMIVALFGSILVCIEYGIEVCIHKKGLVYALVHY